MTEDIRECCIQMTIDFYFRDNGTLSVCPTCEILDLSSAALDDFFRIAFEEDLANELQVGGLFSIRKVPWRVKCFSQCKMLFSNDSSRDSLSRGQLILPSNLAQKGSPIVVMCS